jgi:hypothetical protein
MNTLRLYAAVSCFFLFLSCVENEIETLRVFDLVGKEVLHKTPQQQKLTLNTFTLAPGAYLQRVETPEGEQTVQLLKK